MVVELSAAQVDQVVRAASGGGLLVLLAGLGDRREALEAARQWDDRRVCSSLITGLLLLARFQAEGSASLTEISRSLGTNSSSAHRYLVTLVAAGLIERDPGTRRYRLAQ